MFEESLVEELKAKLPKRTSIRQRLTFEEQDKLFVMYLATASLEERVRMLYTCAMRGYIGR